MIVPKRTIRKARRDEISAISAFDSESTKAGRNEFIRRAVDSGDAHVVEEEGKVVAFGILEYTFFEHGFISLVYVNPQERRTGLGEMLLRYLMSICRTAKLFSSTNLSNLPMRTLFAKVGFEPSGIIHNLDPKDPEVIYYKALRAGEETTSVNYSASNRSST
jgi:N-acetylglutamate synthase-like GNAT family acetyltransferase